MALALGMIEVYGVPAALEVADAMCKAARIIFVGYENTEANVGERVSVPKT